MKLIHSTLYTDCPLGTFCGPYPSPEVLGSPEVGLSPLLKSEAKFWRPKAHKESGTSIDVSKCQGFRYHAYTKDHQIHTSAQISLPKSRFTYGESLFSISNYVHKKHFKLSKSKPESLFFPKIFSAHSILHSLQWWLCLSHPWQSIRISCLLHIQEICIWPAYHMHAPTITDSLLNYCNGLPLSPCFH